jgi:ATP-binding cassette subfamily B protein
MFLRFRAGRAAAQVEQERLAREKLAAEVFGAIRSVALQASLPPAPQAVHPVRRIADEDRRVTDLRLARGAAQRAQRGAIATALPAAMVLAAAWLGHGPLDLPVLVLFAAFGLRMTGALTYLLRADAAAGPALESARRIRDLLDRPPVVEGTAAPPSDATLRFDRVSFAYPGSTPGREVLRDVDFEAEAGRVTAIVGPSGAGKTTLTRLAARLWDVDAGSVTLGGVDLRAFPVDVLMRRVACVFQDVALLDDTVAANLKLGRPEASDEEMMLAASAAGAHEFIGALPAGYETIVGDRGLHLSRGERQRLQIARALIKDAPVVILDEPTSSMDPATEFEVQAALAPLFHGKTVVVVAHRLATIAGADRIVVLGRDGRIEAQGAHHQLLATSPTYARLWADYSTSLDWTPSPQAAGR